MVPLAQTIPRGNVNVSLSPPIPFPDESLFGVSCLV
jgi:hypothetical protein